MSSPFDADFKDLPTEIAIFPLSGALLLPGGQLPLRIFEPRYLSMVQDAMRSHRMIGMVQPRDEDEDMGSAKPYEVGCLGRISAFTETDEGHLMITLSGLVRFRINKEIEGRNGYRLVKADFDSYRDDLVDNQDDVFAASEKQPELLGVVRDYLTSQGFEADWSALSKSPVDQVVNNLAMVCPFEPAEKQALLEAQSLAERVETLQQIMTFATHAMIDDDDNDEPKEPTVN